MIDRAVLNTTGRTEARRETFMVSFLDASSAWHLFSRISTAEIFPLPVRLCQIFPFGSYAASERKCTGKPAPRIPGYYWTVINQNPKVPPRSGTKSSIRALWPQGEPFPAPATEGASLVFFNARSTWRPQELQQGPHWAKNHSDRGGIDFSTTFPCLCTCVCVCSCMHVYTPTLSPASSVPVS